jgi:signal transduction histidine kinase
MLCALGATLLGAFFLYRNNRQKQKANALLNEQKQKVEQTLSELRSTQDQLIQSEKLAGLGELTAGIAHEIQNPLNFVNNFSDELKAGNTHLALEIMTDVKQNLAKIHHHGKRASSIVKGMLEHSRISTGERQLTDLNAICDEYLRLAYHGMKAKNKSFECDFELLTDPDLPKINIVPQDIGRVVLNLLNNAFYAVAERAKQEKSGYQPKVRISTKIIANQAIVQIKDNGIGISKEVKEKIFQPFFTTKPTGEGTGLGLSLAYDIVTKGHGGTMEVETKQGEGTTFIIKLPI